MRILIATGLYPPEIGGPATYARMLEKELPKHGFTVTVIPFGLVRGYKKIIRHFKYAWLLFRERKEADIYYALDPISVGLPTWLVSVVSRKTFLVRLGGDYAWEQGRVRFGLTTTLDEYIADPKKASLRVRGLARLQTFVCKRAKQVVVPSNYLKTVVAAWGIPEEKITVIYSALYPLTVSDSREDLRKQLSYSWPTIVSAGRLVPWKGFSALLESIAAMSEKYPNITCVIAGDGGELDSLKQKARDLNIETKVRFVGSISKEALGATIRAADVFVLNTAYEGLSHQLIEVMDIGTPIVTTTAGGNKELITDYIHGRLVTYNDVPQLTEAIEYSITHEEAVRRFTQTARARTKEFSTEKVAKEVVQLLNLYKNYGEK